MVDAIEAPPLPSKQALLASAPPMPVGFYGVVRYEFQNGRLISAVVEERIKP